MNFRDPSGLAPCFEGESVISCLGRDGLTVDEFNENYCEPWPECWFQEAADYWARRGGISGSLGLNLAAAGNGLSEAFRINSVGANLQEGNFTGAALDVALATPLGRFGRGLKGASKGLRGLFSSTGLSNNTLIGMRAHLLNNGCTQSLTRNGRGYLFTNGTGEEVRFVREAGAWTFRARNQFGGRLDRFGNQVNSMGQAHGIFIFNR